VTGVSVIMPTYNCAQYLDESIPSVLGQSHRELELIVVNNASRDATDETVKKYTGDPRIKYLTIGEKNVSMARNLGIRKARYDMIAFLDADDIFLGDKLEKQLLSLGKHPECGASYTNESYFSGFSRKSFFSTYYHFSGDIFYYLKRNDFIHTSTFLVKKNILPEVPFDESLKSHEDWDLFLRLSKEGVRFDYCDKPLTRVRLRKEGATFNKEVMDMTRREVGLRAKKYWKELKSQMNIKSKKGRNAAIRYLGFKIRAFLIGFPKKACFNKPVPQELL